MSGCPDCAKGPQWPGTDLAKRDPHHAERLTEKLWWEDVKMGWTDNGASDCASAQPVM
jgi:hypothetical protein